MAHTHADFSALMVKYNIPVKTGYSISALGSLINPPLQHALFTGTDERGRLFVNIPVSILRHIFVSRTTSILIYQTDPKFDMFRVSNTPIPHTKTWKRLVEGNDGPDFSNLEELLTGNLVTIYEGVNSEEDSLNMYATLFLCSDEST